MKSLVSQPKGPVTVSGDIDIDPLLEPEIPEHERTVAAPPVDPAHVDAAPAIPPMSPDAPGAGIAPPSVQPAPPVQHIQQVPPMPGVHVPQPPQGYSQQPPPPSQGYPQVPGYHYGYQMPPDGNTSGMGQNYPVPPEASGWTFAGCIPFGLFAFINGNVVLGLVSFPGSAIPYLGALAGLLYFIFIGVQGRELAWRSRRFESIHQFTETMHAWHKWGLIVMFINIGLAIVLFMIYALFFAYIFAAGM